jgi:pyruvate/2-oxoglutarate/acetoin dehydrogenase E1 component
MMESDSRVVVIGEDILDPYGGAFKVTKGLSARFPDRVFATPISEAAIVGVATGMAMRGLRPIVEIMFEDFLTLAADQLINHAAKFRWMYNDEVRVPLVVRTPIGGRRGYGPTHSQCLEKLFLGVPELWVVAPHVLGDPGALLRQATLECEDPVLFIESKTCYGRPLLSHVTGMVSETCVENPGLFPTTYLRHQGKGATPDGVLCCYGGMTPLCLEAQQRLRDQEGLYIDLAVFTQLSPVPVAHIRWILERWRPTVCVYAEESSVMAGWSAEMVAQVEELRTETLETSLIRHRRVGADHVPLAASRELEWQILPQVDDIVQQVLSCF